MSTKLSFIRCDLKNARNLIAEKQRFQIKNSKNYITKFLSRKRPKLEFNNKIFIKSLIANLENRKTTVFLNHDGIDKNNCKLNTIQINKKSSQDDIQSKNNTFLKLRKSQSCNDIYEEKVSLIDNNITSNNKFNHLLYNDIFKNQDIILTPTKNYKKLNMNNKNHIFNSTKKFNQNRNTTSFLIIRKTLTNFNNSGKMMVNNSTNMNKNIKANKSVQSTIDIDIRRKNKSSDDKNKKIKPKLNITNLYFRQIEYLKFLEKKSLALRANYIVNNIHDARGGKQELRALYNPKDK